MMKSKAGKGKSIVIAALGAAILMTGWQPAGKAEAAANAVPSYEVKFMLKADKVLEPGSHAAGSVSENLCDRRTGSQNARGVF
ncbi:hypothetical protein VQ056_12335 [Paenibacillus sp. JTLBN-2024]